MEKELKLSIRALANAYGVSLSERIPDARGDETVTIWEDDDQVIHVTCHELDLHDEDWAPQDTASLIAIGAESVAEKGQCDPYGNNR